MLLYYKNKKSEEEIIMLSEQLEGDQKPFFKNKSGELYFGDNFDLLSVMIKNKIKVDLIYLDPPFATGNTFHIGSDRASTISISKSKPLAYSDTMVEDEFLEYIRERLILLREILSDVGSIYLHIDYKIGHYIKILMDEVFGKENFKNDITRIKCNPKNFKRKSYGNIKDLILFYTKTNNYIWNSLQESRAEGEIERLFTKIDTNGRRYTTNPLHAPGETITGESGLAWNGAFPPEGRHWRYSQKVLNYLQENNLIEWSKNGVPRKIIYADEMETKKIQDIWEFKDSQNPVYPTEKNADLLKRIILSSSNLNSIVLDPFSGSGTTLDVAQKLGRSWIGIDKSKEAMKIIISKVEEKNTSSLF